MNMKITKYILTLAAAIGMFAGCQKAELVQMAAPEDVLAPVLADVADEVIVDAKTMTNDFLEFTWTKADYGVNTQINYAVEVALAGSDTKAVVTSGISVALDAEPVAKVSYETLNKVFLTSLELEPETLTDVNFYVSSQVGQSVKVYSNAVASKVSAASAEIDYPKMTVVGNYQGWSPGKPQYVFDFAGDDKAYEGLVDFGANGFDYTTLEFKITGKDWGAANGEHSVPKGEAQEEEAATIKLVNDGGDNITAYREKRFYHFTFDKTVPSITKNMSFDQVGVIGANGDWENDIVMNFDPAKQKFWADVEFPADSEFKFRLDAAWGTNWGVTDGKMVKDGENIPVAAGKYRIYFNMNDLDALTYELNANDYGKADDTPVEPEEPEQPEEPGLEGWGLVGAFTGWADGADVMLASDGTYFYAKGVELEGELKFRKDGKWEMDFGLAEGASFEADAEIALAKGGANINVTAGTYDVYLDEANAKAWFITDGTYPGGGVAPVVSEWGLIGSLAACSNWSDNITMYESGDYIVAKDVVFAENDEFKFRKGTSWDVAYTADCSVSPDAEYPMSTNGGNTKMSVAGTYDVYVTKTLDKLYVMTSGKTPADAGEAVVTYIDASNIVVGFSGAFGGQEQWTDPEGARLATFESKTLTDEATYAGNYVYKIDGFQMSNGDKFKVRINGAWIGGSDGLTCEGIDASGDGDIVVNEGGTFNIKISFDWDGQKHSDVKVVFTK